MRSLGSILKGVEADVLIHAGDWTGRGTVGELTQIRTQLENIRKQFQWIVYIAGNHDFLFQKNKDLARSILEIDEYVYYLEDSETQIVKESLFYKDTARNVFERVRIYGSPWQPWFHDWAFNLPRGNALREKWKLIPEGLDILVTHTPAYNILDSIDPTRPDPLGCWDLRDIIKQRKPKIHIHGHIHGGYGAEKVGDTQHYNVSICDEDYMPTNPPTIFEI
jgi:Icc-related predicted phosphoesterase